MMLKNKLPRLLALAVAFATALLSLASCTGGKANDKVGTVRLVIYDESPVEYTVDLSLVGEGDGLIPVLDYLAESEGVSYTAQGGGYGAYLTSLGSLKESAIEGKYLYVYTSVEADFDVSVYASTIEYNGMTLTSSGVGISEMTLTDGAVICVGYIIY